MRLNPLQFGVAIGASAMIVGVAMTIFINGTKGLATGIVVMVGGAFFLLPSLFWIAAGRGWLPARLLRPSTTSSSAKSSTSGR